MGKRIVFTGGSGKIGRHVIPYLLKRGHQVLNLDLAPLDVPSVDTVITNLADAGETYNALTLHFGFSEYFGGKGRGPVDAVVHFAALPRIFLRPDNAMFAANVQSTYNVIEAATKLGIRKIVTASSETVYGVCFAEGVRDFTSFPVDEDYDVDPTDSYGLSKVLGEKIARSFASRTGADIYVLRIGGVVEPQDYARFPEFLADPSKRRRDAWTYMDARDLGQIVDLCVEKDGLGFQIFNAVNDNIVAELPTAEFLSKHAPNTPVTRAMDGFEGPISNRKLRDVLGFRQEHDWRTQRPG
ncbi:MULTISPECIES: NAD(P)-dependent oxidoreductase [unclassified Mesorhizobium]|uniref:NAD-dependent epimerase/dehydratase family protein n=1 Tax=unclassified Mesorhizobium TaxID=325217 RepID=UPI001127BE4A|nr:MULTISPECIES: NAD(P)-dependent oxidoreductase [unclassified Mesorhizobium]TPL01060.1 NAD(P)-dependent oxidoreductase [Mesorhizobium sp. B2-4-16]TPL78080.1 NAD(P)-dependent oxidoreductase [Mesorhizobium sp. B2-4-3]